MVTRPTGKIVVAIFADTHPNSTVAICSPDVCGDDGDKHILSKWQMWLWQGWIEYRNEVKKKARGAKLYVIADGDIAELDTKDRSNQLITTNRAIALDIAEDVCRPLTDMADKIFVIRGTGAHTGKSGEYEEIIAKNLGAEKDEYGRHAMWYFLGSIGGVLIEVAHHTAGGRRASTATGGVARLAEDTILEYAGTHDPVPQLVFRGHVHTHHDSYNNVRGCRAITLPCWTGATDHVNRMGLGSHLPDIGAYIVTLENGHFDAVPFIREPIRNRTWLEK